MSEYRKPLRGGGSRIIPRTTGGRFVRATLGAGVCRVCGKIILPETLENAGGFVEKVWPKDCPDCGGEFDR